MVERVLSGLCVIAAAIGLAAGEPRTAGDVKAARGQETVHQALNPPFWSPRAYQEAWKRWGLAEKPADYERVFRERYGLHRAPYDNGGLPMGFTRSRGLLGLGHGLGNDCLLCHAGTVAGQTMIGLGNSSLDMQSLYEELAAADKLDPVMPVQLCNVRGTSEASNFAVYLMQFRDAELRHRLPVKYSFCQNLCEDIPAWWNYKKKKTIYHLGIADSRSVRTLMPFLLIPGNSAEAIKQREADFAQIRAYLLSLQPPRLSRSRSTKHWPIEGRRFSGTTANAVMAAMAARAATPTSWCHSRRSAPMPRWRHAFDQRGVAHYLESWFAREHGPHGEPYHGLGGGGYQAPPLDGIWATAPYLHNGSVPTIYQLLKSSERPDSLPGAIALTFWSTIRARSD